MTEKVGLLAGPRGYGSTKTATAQAIGSAIPGLRSAGPAARQGSLQGRAGRSAGPVAPSSPSSAGRNYTLSSTAHICANNTKLTASSPVTDTAAALAKPTPASECPSSLPGTSTGTSTLLHRQQPRSYLRTHASSSLAASSIDTIADDVQRPPPSQASPSTINAAAVTTSATAARARRASNTSAVSLNPPPPPPGSALSSFSPPSSVGRDSGQASQTPPADDRPPIASNRAIRRRHKSSSFDLPLVARPRPRAYSDQGPRPDNVSRPPQTFYLRRSSNPELPADLGSHLSHSSSLSSLYSRSTREPASFSSKGISTSSGPPPSINGRLLLVAGDDANLAALQRHHYRQQKQQPTRSISSTRQLLPLKTAVQSSPPDETRRRSAQYSYRLSLNGSLPANATPTRVAPIRSFRSSGSRKGLTLPDMNFTPRPYDLNENTTASLYDDDTARASTVGLDARYDQQSRLMTPPVSGRQGPANGDESGDVFLRLAREEALNRTANGRTPDGTYSPVSSTHRSWHRRPLSTHLASYQPISPPKLRRRLSDQLERPNLSNLEDDQASRASRLLQYRSLGRDKAASAHPGETSSQFTASARMHRPPPLSSRSPVYQDNPDSYRHSRRRSSITESTPPISGRGQSYKAGNYSKAYSSSPLVRSFDVPPQSHELPNGVEGTESTASTTAPSTVWDELDELKSRINRLEITGKLPSTSGATITKMTEDRPATANTTVTTASVSPKRHLHVHADETGSVSTPKDAYPILQTALTNCKLNLSSNVYQALDCLAQDALGLSTAMSHGPIPSGASTIGSSNLAGDRQLRRKTESLCRSLTELCIALNDDAGHKVLASQPQTQAYAGETLRGTPSTPILPKSHSGLPVSRRSSVIESSTSLSHTSPRVMSRFEERRNSLLHNAGPPVSTHSNPNQAAVNDTRLSRQSSLLVSRTRQARQEELDDGSKHSALSRSRRAMAEENEDGRKSTYLVRSRRGTGDEMSQPLSRSPTRRLQYEPAHEYAVEADALNRQDTASVVSSATASRRRMASEQQHSSRLAAPTGLSPAPTRKYLERSVSTSQGPGTPTLLDRLSRHVSLHNRGGSQQQQQRMNRESMLPLPLSGNAASDGSQ